MGQGKKDDSGERFVEKESVSKRAVRQVSDSPFPVLDALFRVRNRARFADHGDLHLSRVGHLVLDLLGDFV